MNKKLFNKKEISYYIIRIFCMSVSYPFYKLGNWATEKINKSYYKNCK